MKCAALFAVCFAVCCLFDSPVVAAWTNAVEPMGANVGVWMGCNAWGDYDNDGDLDLAISGTIDTGVNNRLIIYRNEGGGSFTKALEPMGANVGLYCSSIAWGDYDNDGNLDLAVSGTIDDGTNRRLIIFRNGGDGSFTKAVEPMGANKGIVNSSIQWGDYDNDGDLDLAVAGFDDTYVRRLIIYRNDGGNNFVKASEPMGINKGVAVDASIAWGDYDNDGDLDLAVAGADNNSSTPRFIIFRNDRNDSFTNVAEPMGVDTGVSGASVQWGDYDNDGDLDIAITGNVQFNLHRFIIFRNDGGSGFVKAAEPMGANIGVSSISNSIAWGDYDNDGDLDIAISGFQQLGTIQRFVIFRNDGGSSFTNVAEPMGANVGVYGSSIAWGDYDNDGDIDLAVSGQAGWPDNTAPKRLIIFRNDANGVMDVRPAMPILTLPSNGELFLRGDTINFQWSDSIGDATPATAMSYNLRVGLSMGGVQISSADTSDAHSLANSFLGNVQNETDAWLKSKTRISPGYYYWSVQAVDGGQMRSTWPDTRMFIVYEPDSRVTFTGVGLTPGPIWRQGGDTAILAMTIYCAVPFDTLTSCTVIVNGILPVADVAAVRLRIDSNRNGYYDAGDSIVVATLGRSGVYWGASDIGFRMTAADSFLITIDMMDSAATADYITSVVLDTSEARINRALSGWGPQTTLTQIGTWTMWDTTTVVIAMPDTTPPRLRLFPDTAAVAIAAQYFYGTIIDSSGISYLRVSLNGGADSAITPAGQNFGFTLTLRHGENTIVLTGADTAGNVATLTRIVMFADAVIVPTDSRTVTVPNPPAPDTGMVAVKVPTADTFIIAVPVLAANGFRYDDTWIIELNSRDTAVNFIAQAMDPDSVNTGTEQLYRWDEFRYSIFEFSIITDSGADVSDSTATYDALWVTFHVSPQMLARLPQSEIAHLNLFWFNENSRKWVPVGGTQVDVNAGTIRAKLTHFSIYAVFSGQAFATPAGNLSNVLVYPNPYRPNDGNAATGIPYRGQGDGSGIYFNGLVPGTKIEIYDVRGRLIDEMTVPAGTGAVQWDVRNSSGDEVASGVYFILFVNGSEKQTRKLIIVR